MNSVFACPVSSDGCAVAQDIRADIRLLADRQESDRRASEDARGEVIAAMRDLRESVVDGTRRTIEATTQMREDLEDISRRVGLLAAGMTHLKDRARTSSSDLSHTNAQQRDFDDEIRTDVRMQSLQTQLETERLRVEVAEQERERAEGAVAALRKEIDRRDSDARALRTGRMTARVAIVAAALTAAATIGSAIIVSTRSAHGYTSIADAGLH
jgi:hypothetical protein